MKLSNKIPARKTIMLFNGIFFILLACYASYALSIIMRLPLQSWDESLNLLSSWEMQKSGDWIGITRHGVLDHWDIKPPLFTWLSALSFMVFGFSEWAGRLPSVLFGLSTLMLFYFFLVSITRNYLLGIMSTFGIGLSIAFFGQHGIISGDYESMLTFFILLSFISIHKIFFEKKQRWMLLLALSLGLGFMTKSVVGLIPIFFIIPTIIINKGLGFKPDFKIIILSLTLFCLTVIPYFLIRESKYHENYLQLLFSVDVYPKIFGTMIDHQGGWDFYFIQMNIVFREWSKVFYLILLYILFLLIKDRRLVMNHWKTGLLSLAGVIIYLLIFSFSRFKSSWYFQPVYPIMILFIAIVLDGLLNAKFLWIIPIAMSLILIYEARNLVLHVNDKFNRDYEYMTKKIILPNKDLIKDKTIISADTLMPSAITYADILSNGKHTIYSTYQNLNQHIINKKDYDLILATDTSKVNNKEDLILITASGSMGLYQRR
jgi:4-amino-4-deoxy-L-arabinose transferase-like glycosyltransferase